MNPETKFFVKYGLCSLGYLTCSELFYGGQMAKRNRNYNDYYLFRTLNQFLFPVWPVMVGFQGLVLVGCGMSTAITAFSKGVDDFYKK